MLNLSKSTCQKFRDARRALGLTQSEVAKEIGCHQAALSMFEHGKCTKLSSEYVEKLAARLNLDLKEVQSCADGNPPPAIGLAAGYCPDPECPSNSAYSVGSRTFFRITLQKGIYCAHCGEVLEKVCPSCGAQINEGAVCTMCGTPYVK